MNVKTDFTLDEVKKLFSEELAEADVIVDFEVFHHPELHTKCLRAYIQWADARSRRIFKDELDYCLESSRFLYQE